MPVGALVFGHRSVAADIWISKTVRMGISEAVVVGRTIQRLTPLPKSSPMSTTLAHDRQVRMFGKEGQAELTESRVAVIGPGGIGSLVAEYLAHLGFGNFTLVDGDIVEETNLSRVVGASAGDVRKKLAKVKISERVILRANKRAKVKLIVDDVAKVSIASQLTDCDYIFLAADSMRARLVFNAIVHQYLIPGVQLGSKVRSDVDGSLADVMSANRPVRPNHGCLWCNQLIDTTMLAKEAKSDEERRAQEYWVEEPNPSVMGLNAVSAAHAVNDFLLDCLGLRSDTALICYEHFHFLSQKRDLVQPRRGEECSECSYQGLRYARGNSVELPCIGG